MSKPEQITKGGIIIPNTATKQTDFSGVIVAIPRGEEELKIGMRVIVSKRSGSTIETDDIFHIYKLYNKNEIKYIYG